MIRVLDRVAVEATVHLLAGGLLLVGASLLGLGGSVPTLAAFALLAVALFAVRDRLAGAGVGGGLDARAFLPTAWVAPTLSATTTLVAWGATAGEIQSLGGLLGLVGMLNYFLRPVYVGAYSLAQSLRERASADGR